VSSNPTVQRSPVTDLQEIRIGAPLRILPMLRFAVLLLSDMSALILSMSAAYLIWAMGVLAQPIDIYVPAVTFLFLFPLGYGAAGLYPSFGKGDVEVIRRLTYCSSFGFLALTAASFALKLQEFGYYSRITFCMSWIFSLLAVPLFRFGVVHLASKSKWWKEPAVLLGDPKWAAQMISALENSQSIGYKPVVILDQNAHYNTARPSSIDGVPLLGGQKSIPDLATMGVRVVIVEHHATISFLDGLQKYFRHVVIIRPQADFPIERFRAFNLGGVMGTEFTNESLRWSNRVLKRALDIVAGSLAFAVACPIIALSAIVIKLTSEGPAFYSQQREGLDGKPIKVWKLRTMYRDAEQRLDALLSSNPELRVQWERHLKLTPDPRIVGYAGILFRRFSIDELPQLWNVLRGDMSLVGPRPFPNYHMDRFTSEFRGLRQSARPGLTGMWQVMVRSSGTLDEQVFYDSYYIRNWSLWLDVYLLARTAFVVVAGSGA
jgi:Undecaprenyl-phosphate galactose phosphotransferase WbaP